MKRFVLAACLAAALAIAAALGWRAASRPAPPRHVVVISLDTARPDFLGCYGNRWIKTPNLDRLAAESVRMARLTTVVPTTLASHVSLFTGNYPHTHGTPRNGFRVHGENAMLAEVLGNAGFATAGFVSSAAALGHVGFEQGFDTFDAADDRTADQVTDAAIAYMDAAGVPDRLFLFVHYWDPHSPYAPPGRYAEMYTDPAREPNVGLYAGEMSFVDKHVGRLLDDLRGRGVLDDALLWVVSDHGEGLFQTEPDPGHGENTRESVMRIVGLVRLPHAQGAGRVETRPVQNIDLAPATLRLLGLRFPAAVDGIDFDPGTGSGLPDRRPVFCEATKPLDSVETDPRWYNIRKCRSVVEGDAKFTQTPYAGTEELYDLAADPHEARDRLAAEPPDDPVEKQAGALRATLERWADDVSPLPSGFVEEIPDETIDRLKALGYL